MTRAIIAITGPSCSGKSTLEAALVENHAVHRTVSTTTREPREGELDGVDYHFVDAVHFENLHLSGQLIECVTFNGNQYGIPESELRSPHKPYVTVVAEPGGIGQVHAWCERERMPMVLVYIDHDPITLVERLLRRLTRQPARLSEYARRVWMLLADEITWRSRPEVQGHVDLFIDGRHRIPPQALARMAVHIAEEKAGGKVVQFCRRTTPDMATEDL